MEKRYSHILEKWFIMEPPLFQVLCLHELKADTQMTCPLRSGRKRVEYNPDIVQEIETRKDLTDDLKTQILKAAGEFKVQSKQLADTGEL